MKTYVFCFVADSYPAEQGNRQRKDYFRNSIETISNAHVNSLSHGITKQDLEKFLKSILEVGESYSLHSTMAVSYTHLDFLVLSSLSRRSFLIYFSLCLNTSSCIRLINTIYNIPPTTIIYTGCDTNSMNLKMRYIVWLVY